MSDTPKHPIIHKFLTGAMDAGGTIAALEREIAELQSKLSIAEGALMIQDKCAAGYHQQIDELQGKLAETGRERDHWKANHDTQVRRTGLLAERHDLPIDRLPAYREMERLQSKLTEAEKEINGWKIIAHERLIRAIDGDQRIASLEAELKTERENGAKLLLAHAKIERLEKAVQLFKDHSWNYDGLHIVGRQVGIPRTYALTIIAFLGGSHADE